MQAGSMDDGRWSLDVSPHHLVSTRMPMVRVLGLHVVARVPLSFTPRLRSLYGCWSRYKLGAVFCFGWQLVEGLVGRKINLKEPGLGVC